MRASWGPQEVLGQTSGQGAAGGGQGGVDVVKSKFQSPCRPRGLMTDDEREALYQHVDEMEEENRGLKVEVVDLDDEVELLKKQKAKLEDQLAQPEHHLRMDSQRKDAQNTVIAVWKVRPETLNSEP